MDSKAPSNMFSQMLIRPGIDPTFLVLFNYGNQIQSNWTRVKTIHGLKLIERALIFTIIWPDIEAFFICSLVLSVSLRSLEQEDIS